MKIELQQHFISIRVLYIPTDHRDDENLIQQHFDPSNYVLSYLNPPDFAFHLAIIIIPKCLGREEEGLKLDANHSRLTASGDMLYRVGNRAVSRARSCGVQQTQVVNRIFKQLGQP